MHDTIFNALPAEIVVVDSQCRAVAVNERWANLMRQCGSDKPGAGVGESYLLLLDQLFQSEAPSRQAVAQGLWDVLRDVRAEYRAEIPCGTRSGRAWCQVIITPLRTEPARGAVITHVDISERRQNAAAVQQAKVNMALAQQIAHLGSWEIEIGNPSSGQSSRLYWSDEVFRIFGYEPGGVQVSREFFLDAVHPDDRDRVRKVVAEAIARRERYSVEHRIILPHGDIRHVREEGLVLPGPDGEPRKLVGAVMDISQQKEADQRIRQQAALLDGALDAIFVTDLQGRILYWNKSAERIHGWNQEEVLGRLAEEFLHKERSQFLAARECVLATSEWSGETLNRTRQGRDITLETRWTLVRDEGGAPKAILSLNTDVTEKKRLEAQFLRAQRLESLGTLAGGIAHDLNNVLAPILMAVLIVRERIIDEELIEVLNSLEANVHRGSDLVRQVLAFARGVEGKRTTVHFQHLFRELQHIIRDTFPKSIVTEIRLAEGLSPVTGDATQLHQVLLNLCLNARDAMPNGGSLLLAGRDAHFDEHYAAMHPEAKPGRHVVIEVTDTGTGISPENLQKIFEPFFTTKELGQGTGLGLSTVLGIVKSHGGFVRVYSEPGRGSTFRVYLPAERSEERFFVESESGALPRGHGEQVLIVDDEEAILEITSKTLDRYGYAVLTANNGADAIAQYVPRQNQIDVVLIDMTMPIMDGAASILALKKINPRVKIIAASGLASNMAVAKSAGGGVDYFLHKPYTAEALLQTLEKVLADRRKPSGSP